MIPGQRDVSRRSFLGRVGGFLAVAFMGDLGVAPRGTFDLEHPEPRPGVTAEKVLSPEAVGAKRSKKVLDAYDAARNHPAIFDGVACGCSCGNKNGTHRSLLVCFETMQPTGCWECQQEGVLVGRMAREEKSLAEIRAAVDKEFG